MGGALLARWLAVWGPGARCVVHDPAARGPADPRVQHCADASAFSAALPGADILVLAVKPQVLARAVAALEVPGGLPVVSIAAGVPVAALRALVPGCPVVRAMPNLPAAVGRGVTALAGDDVPAARALFAAVGAVEPLDEAQFDAFTALAGSGPAYVFYLTEALARAGEGLGLAPDAAARVARATVEGAAAMLHARAGQTPGELRDAVTSPGGTTAAALAVLTDGRLDAALAEALAAGAARSRALAN
jgi:pyrroline-5-carboxylate reductase